MTYEILSLVPAVIAITLAFWKRNVYISLGLGLYSGIYIYSVSQGMGYIFSLFWSVIQIPVFMTMSLGDGWNAGIVMQVLFIGGLVYLITYTGGLRALAKTIGSKASTPKTSQMSTFIMGIIIFFDDYANCLITGSVMRTITDKAKVSREKLSFIIDATAAPIAGLVIVSTWIGYELSLIYNGLEEIGVDESAFEIFVRSIPYRFYNILILIFIILTIYLAREYGPMLKAEIRTRKTGKVKEEKELTKIEEAEELVEKEGYEASAWEGVIPLLTLIIGSFTLFYTNGYRAVMGSEDTEAINVLTEAKFSLESIMLAYSNADASVVLSQAALIAIIVTLIMSRKAFKFGEGINVTLTGMKSLLPIVIILILAWSIGTIMSGDYLDTGGYIASLLGDTLPSFIVPMLVFIIAAIMAFATGTSYGTMGILMPLAIPLVWAVAPGDMELLTITIGAVLTGTIVGDHCSPISDTTILASTGSDIDHLDHVDTQLPYALTVALISAVAYLLAGFKVNPFIIIGLGIISMVVVLLVYGKKVDDFIED